MNETTPDDEPEHIGRSSWLWHQRLNFFPRGIDAVDALTCAPEVRQIVYLLGEASTSARVATPKPAPVAELPSLSEDTPPSPLGLDGVFYVYEP